MTAVAPQPPAPQATPSAGTAPPLRPEPLLAAPKRRGRSDLAAALLFLAPNFLGFVVFTLGPVAFSLVVSFTDWTLGRGYAWTGTDNFRTLLTQDGAFWLYLVNTAYLMLGLPVAVAGSLVLALLLSQKLRGMSAYRTLFFLPSFTYGVALIILWKALYNPEIGPINVVLRFVLEDLRLNDLLATLGAGRLLPPVWLQSVNNLLALRAEAVGFRGDRWGLGARDAIIFMGVWTLIGGNNMLLYLAALTNVPQELYEAAEIDGAGRWTTFWHVTWPQLAPTTFFIVIMSVIGGLQGGFEQARVMTLGGPAGTTTTLAYYIYIKAFEQFQMGYASAVSWVLFSMIFVMTMVGWRFGNRAMND